MFPPGTMVRGRVMTVDAQRSQAELSLRLSDINPDKYGKRLEFADIKVRVMRYISLPSIAAGEHAGLGSRVLR
jgi:hypothetical protein